MTGDDLFQVVRLKTATAGRLDSSRWRELKSLLVPWLDGLDRILAKVEELGVWLEGLLDAYSAMIPKVGGDSTPQCQRRLSVLPVIYRVWASARMKQLEGWFKSWFQGSVYSAGDGRSSVEARKTTALDIEEVLAGAVDTHVHVFVDVIKSFDTVDRGSWIVCLAVWVCLPGFVMRISSITLMLGFALSLLLVLVNLGLGMGEFLKAVL